MFDHYDLEITLAEAGLSLALGDAGGFSIDHHAIDGEEAVAVVRWHPALHRRDELTTPDSPTVRSRTALLHAVRTVLEIHGWHVRPTADGGLTVRLP